MSVYLNYNLIKGSENRYNFDPKDNFSKLPQDVLILIFKDLNVLDLRLLTRVSKKSRCVARLVIDKKMDKIQQLFQLMKQALDQIESPIDISLTCNQKLPNTLEDSAIILAKLGGIKSSYAVVEKHKTLGFTSNLEFINRKIGRELVKAGNIADVRPQKELFENETEYLFWLSEVQLEIKNFDEAEKTLDLIKLDVSNKLYSYHSFQLAKARAKAGNFTKAREAATNSKIFSFKIRGLIEIAFERAKLDDREESKKEFANIGQMLIAQGFSSPDSLSDFTCLIERQIEVRDFVEAWKNINVILESCKGDNDYYLKKIVLAFIQAGEIAEAAKIEKLIKNRFYRGNLEEKPVMQQIREICVCPHPIKDKKIFQSYLESQKQRISGRWGERGYHEESEQIATIYLDAGYIEEWSQLIDGCYRSKNDKATAKISTLVKTLFLYVTNKPLNETALFNRCDFN